MKYLLPLTAALLVPLAPPIFAQASEARSLQAPVGQGAEAGGAAGYAATVANGTDKPQRVTLAFEPNKSAAMTPSADPSSLELALSETISHRPLRFYLSWFRGDEGAWRRGGIGPMSLHRRPILAQSIHASLGYIADLEMQLGEERAAGEI